MAHGKDERKAVGRRLAAARNLAGFTMEAAAAALTERGHQISKAGVGAWEVGRNLPDALWLRRLAKLYGTSVDALVWDESLSPEAMKVAAEYDHLTDAQRRTWNLLWLGFIARGAEGGELLPAAPAPSPTPVRPAMGLVPKVEDVGDELPETTFDGEKFPLKHPRKRRQ